MTLGDAALYKITLDKIPLDKIPLDDISAPVVVVAELWVKLLLCDLCRVDIGPDGGGLLFDHFLIQILNFS